MGNDKAGMVFQLKGVLPDRWFADPSPLFNSLLGGLAEIWRWLHDLNEFVRRQTRISTASGSGSTLLLRTSSAAGSFAVQQNRPGALPTDAARVAPRTRHTGSRGQRPRGSNWPEFRLYLSRRGPQTQALTAALGLRAWAWATV